MMGALACELLGWEGAKAVSESHIIGMTVLFGIFVSLFLLTLILLSALGRLADGDTIGGHLARYGQAHLPVLFMAFLSYHTYYLLTLVGPLMRLAGTQLGIDQLQLFHWHVEPGVVRFLITLIPWCGFFWTMFLVRNIAKQKKGSLWTFTLHSLAAFFMPLFFLVALHFHFFNISYL